MNENQKNDQSRIKSLIKETLYNSTAQAIITIIETRNIPLKCFLFICVILSSGLCSYLIIELIMGYLTFDVSTKYRTYYENPALFPKVTICNVNPFTTQYAMEFLKKVNMEINPYVDIFNQDQMNKLDFSFKYYLISNIFDAATYKMNKLNETEKKKLSHSFEEILVPFSCYFNLKTCSTDDFVWHFDPWFGNCWIFNSGYNRTVHRVPLKMSSFPGDSYGLKMSLYVNFFENLTSINSLPSFGGGLGALIRIDNSSYKTNYIIMDGIRLPGGDSTSVSVMRSFKSFYPQPYSNCLIDNLTKVKFQSDLFDLIHKTAYRYTQPMCFMQCLQRTLILECNCTYSAIISLFPNASMCFKQNEIDCINNVFFGKVNQNDFFFQENCLPECPLECYSDKFNVLLSSSELIPKYYLDYLNSSSTNLFSDFLTTKIDADTARKSFSHFSIFYNELSYEISNESPQLSLITLFANMGGYLGLFLGMSVFSLFEPVQLIIEILYMKFSKTSA